MLVLIGGELTHVDMKIGLLEIPASMCDANLYINSSTWFH